MKDSQGQIFSDQSPDSCPDVGRAHPQEEEEEVLKICYLFPILWGKSFDLKLSENEVCCTNA